MATKNCSTKNCKASTKKQPKAKAVKNCSAKTSGGRGVSKTKGCSAGHSASATKSCSSRAYSTNSTTGCGATQKNGRISSKTCCKRTSATGTRGSVTKSCRGENCDKSAKTSASVKNSSRQKTCGCGCGLGKKSCKKSTENRLNTKSSTTQNKSLRASSSVSAKLGNRNRTSGTSTNQTKSKKCNCTSSARLSGGKSLKTPKSRLYDTLMK